MVSLRFAPGLIVGKKSPPRGGRGGVSDFLQKKNRSSFFGFSKIKKTVI